MQRVYPGYMVNPEDVRRCLEAAFPGARIVVENPGGDGEHLEVQVASATFAGRGLVDQHRMVYAALGDLMSRIHALQLRTETQAEGIR
jgi:stress-induced morphogen